MTVTCFTEPVLGFHLFRIRICELVNEVLLITRLSPSLSNLRSDGPGCPADLISQRIALLLWETFGNLKN